MKLVAPQFVKPYVKSNKNDANDAEAVCEAMSRPNMRFVAVKTVDQQDMQAAHRIRSELISQRTAKANQLRGLVAEYGLVAPQQLARLRAAVPVWLEDAENGLTNRFRGLLSISKRGDAYLRSILIHGARSVIRTAKQKDERLSQWVTSLAERRHPNVAAVALANKTARIAWAMLRHGMDYEPDYVAA